MERRKSSKRIDGEKLNFVTKTFSNVRSIEKIGETSSGEHVTTRGSSTPLAPSNNLTSNYEYVEDEWERSPKTDYTYANSASYNSRYDESYIIPNMSRPSLRTRDVHAMSTPSKFSTVSTDSAGSTISGYYLRSSTFSTTYSQESSPSSLQSHNVNNSKADVLDKLVPMETTLQQQQHFNQPIREDYVGQGYLGQSKVKVTKSRQSGLVGSETMVSKSCSPMVPTTMLMRKTLMQENCRDNDKRKKRNVIVRIITTVCTLLWSILTYPSTHLLPRLSSSSSSSSNSSNNDNQRTPKRHQPYVENPARNDMMRGADDGDDNSNVFGGHGNDGGGSCRMRRNVLFPDGGSGRVARKREDGDVKSGLNCFLYSLAGTIGGVIYVLKNALLHICGLVGRTTTSVDDAVLSRSYRVIRPTGSSAQKQQQQHSCQYCALSLFIIISLLLIGGMYFYLCGPPNHERAYDLIDSYYIQLKDYAKPVAGYPNLLLLYACEKFDGMKSSLLSLLSSSSSSPPPPPPSQPLPPPQSSSTPSPQSSSPSPQSSSSSSPDLTLLASKKDLSELRSHVDAFINKNWKVLIDDQCKGLSDSLNVKFESSSKRVEEQFTKLLNERLKQLKDDVDKRINQLIMEDDEHDSLILSLKDDVNFWKEQYTAKLSDLVALVGTKKSKDDQSDRDSIEKLNKENLKQIDAKLQDSLTSLKVSLIMELQKHIVDQVSQSVSAIERGSNEISDSEVGEKLSRGEIEDIVRVKLDAYFNELFSVDKEKSGKLRYEKMTSSTFNDALMTWLSSNNYVSKDDVDEKLILISNEMSTKFQYLIEEKIKMIADDKLSSVSQEHIIASDAFVTKDEVLKIMNESISRYDADKTGMADYALESAGGSIIGTRCSKTYKKGMSQVSVFGIPLWYATNSPRTVIQPGNLPGQCWPFSGSVGYLVVQLATRIHVTTVSIEHVSKIITTFGGIESAPKEFAVVGLSDSQDVEGTILGNFTYNKDGLPLQYFNIPVEHHSSSYLFVELRVYSNHGNDNYTCLYRFRVHGKPDLKS